MDRSSSGETGKRPTLARRLLRITVLGVATLCVLTGVAHADVSTDISGAGWQSEYGVSAEDVYQLAQGYADGTFRPDLVVTRGQFAKMSMNAFGLLPWDYPEPRFSDVPPGHYWYPYVMGVSWSSSFMDGYPDGTFRPDKQATRGEAYSAIGRWVRSPEDTALGGINGEMAVYASISSWFRQEGEAMLDRFADHEFVPPADRPVTAYLVMRGVIRGTTSAWGLCLRPQASLTRAQAVALLLRARTMAYGEVPAVTGVTPAIGSTAGDTRVVITGTGFTGMSTESEWAGVAFGSMGVSSYTVDSPTQITAVAPPLQAGTVYVRVKNGGGGMSAMVPAAQYTYVAQEIPVLLELPPVTWDDVALVEVYGKDLASAARVLSPDVDHMLVERLLAAYQMAGLDPGAGYPQLVYAFEIGGMLLIRCRDMREVRIYIPEQGDQVIVRHVAEELAVNDVSGDVAHYPQAYGSAQDLTDLIRAMIAE